MWHYLLFSFWFLDIFSWYHKRTKQDRFVKGYIKMEKFSLRWNDYQSNASKSFQSLRHKEDFCDVTLVGDDYKQVTAHKVILSSCSEYFDNILSNSKKHAHPHPQKWAQERAQNRELKKEMKRRLKIELKRELKRELTREGSIELKKEAEHFRAFNV